LAKYKPLAGGLAAGAAAVGRARGGAAVARVVRIGIRRVDSRVDRAADGRMLGHRAQRC
jgi:hypothetical protein